MLITNAEERSVLASCRTLHSGGYDVTAASSAAFAPAQWSLSCTRRLRIVDAREYGDRFVEQLRRELARHPYVTLIPGSDSSLLAISQGRERLQPLTELGLPSISAVERALSRERLAEAAEQAGFVPAVSLRCSGIEQALAGARLLGFPVVIKAAAAVSVRDGAFTRAPKANIVRTEGDLAPRALAFGDDLLVQRWVGGDVISFGGVIGGGRLLGVAVSRYERMWPPDSGSVTFGQTIPSPPRLEKSVERLLAAIGWEGIFELELIHNGPDDFVPIDLNPRPYGSMALASAAGVPLATIWCDYLLGRRPQPAHARSGARYRWADGELRHLAWQLRRGDYKAAMAPLRVRHNVTNAHLKLNDPLPLLARGLYLGKRFSEERRRPPRTPSPPVAR